MPIRSPHPWLPPLTFPTLTLFLLIIQPSLGVLWEAYSTYPLIRPDISFSINKVCQFIHDPKIPHWTAMKCILHYPKSTINHGLFHSKKSTFKLHAKSYAKWTGCLDDCRSTSSYSIFLGHHPIS